MIELDTATFRPPSDLERMTLASLGRSDLTFDGLMRAAVRSRFLRASSPALDADAALGLRVIEEAACLALAARPALDAREYRHKEAVLRPLCHGGGSTAVMLIAALERDRLRLREPDTHGIREPAVSVAAERRPRAGRGDRRSEAACVGRSPGVSGPLNRTSQPRGAMALHEV